MNNVYNLIIISMIAMTSLHCDPDATADHEEAMFNEWFYGIIFSYFINRNVSPEIIEHKLEDAFDGTVILKSVNASGTVINTAIFKKCLQGQNYRPTENDCRGSGTVGNFWNATPLQFCTTNSDFCNYDNPNSSEALQSCNVDSTAEKKWKAGDIFFLLSNVPYFSEIYTEFPYGDPIGVWSGMSNDPAKATYYVYPPIEVRYEIKTEYKYVLCVSYIP